MIRKHSIVFFSLLIAIGIISSCSVQKRRYQKGFYFAGIHKSVESPALNQSLLTTAAPDSCATIYFTDGTSIKGNVVEINSKDIYYRYCVDDGKEHKSSKLRLKSITYANGRVENFDPNTRAEIPQPIAITETKQVVVIDTIKGVPVASSTTTNSAAPTATSACDVIIFRDGTEDEVIVKEVNDENVRYKLCSMQDGPDFVKNKSQIFMIKYRSGAKDIFKENSYPQIKTVNQNTDTNFKPKEGLAMASLTASILGIYPLFVLGSVVGLILGLVYLQKNRINPKLYPEAKAAKAGVIIAIVMLALEALLLIAILSLI